MRLAVACVWLLLCSAYPAEASADDDPAARELAQAWFDQLVGFDALEAYRLVSRSFTMEFAVARRWRSGGAQIRISVLAPPNLDTFSEYLLLQNADGPDDYFGYPDPVARVARMTIPDFTLPLPYSGSALPVGELRPYRPRELRFSRLPDEVVDGESCRVVRGERTGAWPYYDQLELAISTQTGVALRTRYLREGKELRRVEVKPADVARFDDARWLPRRRRVVIGDEVAATLELRNLVTDPALPDRLFTKHSLRYERVPSF